MADISSIKLKDNSVYDLKDAAVRERVTRLEQSAANWGISKQYIATLIGGSTGWSGSGPYTQVVTIADLTCGSDGTVSPIISYTSNLDEYSLIDSATATPKTGSTDGYITFNASTKPTNDIGIIVIDVR